jgi:hypothetical protein
LGRRDSDPAEHWLNTQKMMYAVCKCVGIRYLAFKQPNVCGGHDIGCNELECIEHIAVREAKKKEFMDYQRWQPKISQLIEEEELLWMHDLSDVFDGFGEQVFSDYGHFTEEGAKKIAEYVCDCLERY